MFLPDCAVNEVQCVDVLLFKPNPDYYHGEVNSLHLFRVASIIDICVPAPNWSLIGIPSGGIPNLELIRWFLTEVFVRHSRGHPWL